MTVCYSDDGNYHMTTMTKATLYHHGLVKCTVCTPQPFCFCCSADGNYHIITMTKATLYHHGLVKWTVGTP